jgi:putative DNA primase/helicase
MPWKTEVSPADALRQFSEFLENSGLDLRSSSPRVDGRWYNVPLIHQKSGRSGGYMAHFDDSPVGFFHNHRTGERGQWKPDGDRVSISHQEYERTRRYRRRREERMRRLEQIKHASKTTLAGLLLARSTEADPCHPYLVRKGVGAHGLRQLTDELVVPLSDVSGKLWSVQFIRADGDKRLLAGARKSGLFHMLGEAANASDLAIAEGYATAATVHEVVGIPVAVAIDAHNLMPVAISLRAQYRDSAILVCADNDAGLMRRSPPLPNVGVDKAIAAARTINGSVSIPPADGDSLDWNDYRIRNGDAWTSHAIRNLSALCR